MEQFSTFTIDTELSPSYYKNLLMFIVQNYLKKDRLFGNIEIFKADDTHFLTFTVADPVGRWSFDVEVRAGAPIQVKMVFKDIKVPKDVVERFKDDLFISVQLFEEKARKTTLYFTWVEGEEMMPERLSSKKNNMTYRFFSESMLLFYVVFIFFSIILFLILGPYTPILLVIIQFALVLLSGKIVERIGDWEISEKNPNVHILQYQLPIEDQRNFLQKYGQDAFAKIKKEIYSRTLAVGRPLDCGTAREVLREYELECSPENISAKVVNIYGIVKEGAERFRLPVPKIVVSNTTVPNAAASGPGPRFGIMLITTGLLMQLEDDEILGVVGHELSHLKGRDTLAFFGLMSTEYMLRVYVLWPLLVLLGFFYLFIAFSVVYFIAKFFESKADLESAVRIGQPKVLAEGLRKIGFVKLLYERVPSYRFQEWIGFDPHPPIYFRVDRLERLENPERIKHPLAESVRDNLKAFFSSLK
ncbi:MAG: M48 family metallopeptidase [Nitrososphaeria archaeon]